MNTSTEAASTNLLQLSVVIQGMVPFLAAPDVLSFVSTCRTAQTLGSTSTFWQSLTAAQFRGSGATTTTSNNSRRPQDPSHQARQEYLHHAYCQALPQVQWYSIAEGPLAAPGAREGHGMCRIGNHIVLTGGFTQDSVLYIKHIRTAMDDWGPDVAWHVNLRVNLRADNVGRLQWVYGASWTTLDDTRAVCFGGFRGGGYSDESAQVAVLHLHEDNAGGHGDGHGDVSARWEIVQCRDAQGRAWSQRTTTDDATQEDYTSRRLSQLVPRAYAATALWQNRYLIVVGGMQSDRSILDPLVLDTVTWTWYSENLPSRSATHNMPPDRHGCSLIADPKRGRLVLFGGGSGSDLLRSGEDFADVWQLDLQSTSSTSGSVEEFLATTPWKWSQLHRSPSSSSETEEVPASSPNVLSRTEQLNLGRCHACHKISDDTCLLVFGSGRPSSNTLLGYRLDRDEFFRPAVTGPLPQARFTFASVFVPELGYLLVHGGYSSQSSDSISGMCALDCCPGLRRPFHWWPVDAQARSHPPVALGQGPTLAHEAIIELLNDIPPLAQHDVAQTLLDTHVFHDPRSLALLRFVATGQIILQRREDSEEEDEPDGQNDSG